MAGRIGFAMFSGRARVPSYRGPNEVNCRCAGAIKDCANQPYLLLGIFHQGVYRPIAVLLIRQ